MRLNVGKEITAVQRMTVGELRDRYAEVFGEETSARNKQWLIKRIIWRVQSLAEGSLSEQARTRAAGCQPAKVSGASKGVRYRYG